MQISIKEIKHENKTSQAGKDFVSCKIKTWSENQQKDMWISGFGNSITETWAVGDTVDVDLEQKGEYWNFNLNNNSRPSKTALDVLKEISAKLDVLISSGTNTYEMPKSVEELAKDLGGEVVPKIVNGKEENPISVSEIPF